MNGTSTNALLLFGWNINPDLFFSSMTASERRQFDDDGVVQVTDNWLICQFLPQTGKSAFYLGSLFSTAVDRLIGTNSPAESIEPTALMSEVFARYMEGNIDQLRQKAVELGSDDGPPRIYAVATL